MINDDYSKLSLTEIDMLLELANIGAGNAATALSLLLDQRVYKDITKSELVDYSEAVVALGGPEKIVMGMLSLLSGQINGLMLYVANIEFLDVVLEHLLGAAPENLATLTEMEESALEEVGNIMISSYFNAISDMSGLSIGITVPALAVNMLGAILSTPMVEYAYPCEKVLLIEEKLKIGKRDIDCSLILLPDTASFQNLMEAFGLGGAV